MISTFSIYVFHCNWKHCYLKKVLILLRREFSIKFEVFEKVAFGGVSSEFHDGLGRHSFEEFERAECATTSV